MSRIWIFLLMVLAGAVSALQPGINARLAQKVGTLESAFISFAGGAICLIVAVSIFGRGNLRHISAAAPWEVLGGLIGAVYVTCLVLAVPRIGTAAAMAGAIAAQLAAGLLLDSMGAFGFQKMPLDLPRAAGAFFLVLGSLLILRK